MTTPEKTLKRMLDKTGLSSDSDAEAGSNEAAEDDNDDDEDVDEPDLDALATRLSAKVGWHHLKFFSDSGGLYMLHLKTLGWHRWYRRTYLCTVCSAQPARPCWW